MWTSTEAPKLPMSACLHGKNVDLCHRSLISLKETVDWYAEGLIEPRGLFRYLEEDFTYRPQIAYTVTSIFFHLSRLLYRDMRSVEVSQRVGMRNSLLVPVN